MSMFRLQASGYWLLVTGFDSAELVAGWQLAAGGWRLANVYNQPE